MMFKLTGTDIMAMVLKMVKATPNEKLNLVLLIRVPALSSLVIIGSDAAGI